MVLIQILLFRERDMNLLEIELKSFKNIINFLEPPKANLMIFIVAHTKNYVDNFINRKFIR